jgi:hypothetical protein
MKMDAVWLLAGNLAGTHADGKRQEMKLTAAATWLFCVTPSCYNGLLLWGFREANLEASLLE